MTTATTYKAWELRSFSLQDVAATAREESRLEPQQVRIAVKAVSLNFRDLLVARGHYNPKLPLPVVPLSDGAGEVVAVGDRVSKFKKGDRVMPNFMPDWIAGEVTPEAAKTALGGFVDGMLREQATFNESALVHIPSHLSYEEAATLPCAALTAWSALMVNGALKPGETVLTMGSGGVSIFALQLAKAAGARVIATSGANDKLNRLKELGADTLINYKEHPNWDELVLEATGGRGVDHIVEVGGAGTLERSMKAARMNGHVSVIGVLDGISGSLNAIALIMKSLRLQGVFVGSRSRFEDMNKAISLHGIKPVVDRVFAADEITEALSYMASGQHFGKIVLRL
ncbi:MAG: NAD(P)-dependent alcohol dehydrogenase [Candidatus Melainabacteria bacterium]|nr:NAD(P)-dependent alcohol dehydrogenase [Candidatus Melainabacteria bacterium]